MAIFPDLSEFAVIFLVTIYLNFPNSLFFLFIQLLSFKIEYPTFIYSPFNFIDFSFLILFIQFLFTLFHINLTKHQFSFLISQFLFFIDLLHFLS